MSARQCSRMGLRSSTQAACAPIRRHPELAARERLLPRATQVPEPREATETTRRGGVVRFVIAPPRCGETANRTLAVSVPFESTRRTFLGTAEWGGPDHRSPTGLGPTLSVVLCAVRQNGLALQFANAFRKAAQGGDRTRLVRNESRHRPSSVPSAVVGLSTRLRVQPNTPAET